MRALQAGFKDYISILLFLKEASEPAGKRRGQQNKTKNFGGGRGGRSLQLWPFKCQDGK